MKKKILLRSILGAPIGITISSIIAIIISLCIGNGEYISVTQELIEWCGNETNAVIVQTICCMFIGAVCSGASVIWEIENWSLTKQTLLHFAIFIVLFIPMSYILNWMPHSLYGALCYSASFIFMYIIIWVSTYFSIKAKIKKINQQLQDLQQKNKNIK